MNGIWCLEDNYSHLHDDIEYTPESIKCPELEDLIDYQFSGCFCTTNCSPENCICIQRSGAIYNFKDQNDTTTYSINETSSKPFYECNNNCTCSQLCGNKLVQFGPRKDLIIQQTLKKGSSLVTLGPIHANAFICEYAGQIITDKIANSRQKLYGNEIKMNYIFCINEHFGTNVQKTIIDPTKCGNVGRYINHSCQANCNLYTIRITDPIPKLCIFSNQRIEAGEEICFNYGDNIFNTNSTTDDEIENRVKCYCESKKCTGFLPFDPRAFS